MQLKDFKKWTYGEVEDVFGLIKIDDTPLILNWLKAKHQPDTVRTVLLEELRADLRSYANSWNKDELKNVLY